MRSIPLAMIWEMLRRGRWGLLLGLLGANVLPTIIFSAFGRMDSNRLIEMDEAGYANLHSTLVQCNMFIFGMAVLSAQGLPSRLFAYPVSTSMLVFWQMFLGMLLGSLEMLLSTLFLNAVYHVGWPLWAPAAFVAVSFGMLQATFWFTEKSAWLPLAVIVTTGPLGYWFLYRFSVILTRSKGPILDITPVELILLLMVAIAAYLIAVAGVSRNRCGEQIRSLGIVDWLKRVFDLNPVFSPPFRSANQAQSWYEWSLKGPSLPVIVVFGLFFMFAIWLIASRNPKDLVEGCIQGGVMFSVAGLIIGMLIGNCGPADSNFQMGHYQATRPISSVDMSLIMLKVAAKSVFIAWTIWATAFAIVSGLLLATGYEPHPFFPPGFRWEFFPATLVGCWTTVAVIASIVMTGRGKGMVQLFCAGITLYIGVLIAASVALSRDSREQLFRGLIIAIGIALVLCSAYLFACARRRQLVTWQTTAIAACAWFGLSTTILLDWRWNGSEPVSSCVLGIGLAALTVVPFAAAPLALTWNRNR